MSAPRLSNGTLADAGPDVRRPGYDRSAPPVGIVHLGLGAFARAHLLLYTEDLLEAGLDGCAVAGASLQRPDQRDRLQPQDGLFTALERDGDRTTARVVGCLRRVVVAPEQPAALLDLLAAADTRVVSLTVTEKGYCHDPATGRLDASHPDIRHDIAGAGPPRSAVGWLVAGLARRREEGRAPFTVLCCDNLPHNGRLLRGLVRDFAALRNDGLAGWIERDVAFPSTMVDRIVPAVTAADRAEAAALTGLEDAAPVGHEPFRQWVLEDRFGPLGRPSWERAGAQLVGDVAPFEHMKLRLLNGAHSALAYLGSLAGHETVPDAVADPVICRYLEALWDEIIPTVPPPPGVDLREYTRALLSRFANTAIRHRTAQIANDGSQKLPQRLLATVRERLRRDLPIPNLALAVAAWIRYVGGTDEHGGAIIVNDPLLSMLQAALNGANAPRERVEAILAIEAVFGDDLRRDERFVAEVTQAFQVLMERGVRATLAGPG